MSFLRRFLADCRGATAVEVAFALPALVLMMWLIMQLALVYRAVAGIQQALGEGARYATLCINPTTSGCTAPTGTQIKTRIENSVYGIGPGHFDVPPPTLVTAGTSKYYDLTVTYTQETDMLVAPGPDISVTKSKRVWVAGT